MWRQAWGIKLATSRLFLENSYSFVTFLVKEGGFKLYITKPDKLILESALYTPLYYLSS